MFRNVLMVLATTVALTGPLSAAASGGSPVGPMGQIFDGVNPVDHPFIFDRPDLPYGYHYVGGSAENAYGYVGVPHARPRKKANSR
jgi:hypothetical protein